MLNKIINYKSVSILALLVMLTSCNDYLSETPDDRTDINSPEKISALITGAYPESSYLGMASMMSDNADFKVEGSSDDYEEAIYVWGDVSSVTDFGDRDTPVHYWNHCYEAISQANQALASIESLSGNFDLDAQKGEALVARAYSHFMLVNFWAQRYDPATASSALGIPYVLKPETVLLENYERNTVQETYDLIEKDLTEGLALIENNYEKPKFHFTKEAAAAFAARFYLYKGDWDNVIKYASLAVTNPEAQLRNMLEYRSLSYDENRLRYPSSLENTNLLIAYTSSLWARRFTRTNFGLSARKASELFFGGAGNPYGKAWAYGVYGNDQVYNLPKFREYFRFTNQSAGIGQPFLDIVLFDRDEALLNRAEAYAMKNDYANALADLNIYLSKKTAGHDPATDILTEEMVTNLYPVVTDEFTPFYAMDSKQTSFIKAIAEFKRREYYHEGLRWFDVKRFNIVVTHRRTVTGDPFILEKDDNRRALQIPRTAIDFGLAPNPR